MVKRRTIRVVIWVLIIVITLTLGLWEDGGTLIQYADEIAVAIVILLVSISTWRLKRAVRNRMQKGLQRPVADHELTSFATWMKIPEQAKKAARDAEKYDFND
jgi:hypothetical protein